MRRHRPACGRKRSPMAFATVVGVATAVLRHRLDRMTGSLTAECEKRVSDVVTDRSNGNTHARADGVEIRSEEGTVVVWDAEVLGPSLANEVSRLERGRPVDGGASTESGACKDVDGAVFGGRMPSPSYSRP